MGIKGPRGKILLASFPPSILVQFSSVCYTLEQLSLHAHYQKLWMVPKGPFHYVMFFLLPLCSGTSQIDPIPKSAARNTVVCLLVKRQLLPLLDKDSMHKPTIYDRDFKHSSLFFFVLKMLAHNQ